jgi:hypothetical protein
VERGTLAWRKPEARLTRSTGGEKVNGCASRSKAEQAGDTLGLRVKARRLSRRRKALSDCRVSRLYRRGVPESSGSQVSVTFIVPQGAITEQRIGRFGDRLGRACG